jgi:hypothetical protein
VFSFSPSSFLQFILQICDVDYFIVIWSINGYMCRAVFCVNKYLSSRECDRTAITFRGHWSVVISGFSVRK